MSIIIAFFLFALCSPGEILDHAVPKWKHEPKMEMRDAYKWLHQAANGGEHAAPSEEAARKWLDAEWDSLGEPMDGETFWEPLCSDGSIGRFNLRPFKSKGGDPDAVLQAFLRSAAEYKSDGKDFAEVWNELGKRLKKKAIGKLRYEDWKTLDDEMKAKHYPAVHHSETYSAAHRPAYRIITRSEMQRLRSALGTDER